MKLLCEKKVYTEEFGGTVDLITGIDDFETPDLDYNEEFHTYRVKGEIVPSVTRLLDDGEYINVDEEILKYAQIRGTIVHKEIQEWLEEGIEGFTPELYEFIRLFEEKKELFEKEAIFDFKTYSVATPLKRKKCYEQETMYSEAIEYLTGIKIKQKYLILLPKNNKGRIYDLTKEFEGECYEA